MDVHLDTSKPLLKGISRVVSFCGFEVMDGDKMHCRWCLGFDAPSTCRHLDGPTILILIEVFITTVVKKVRFIARSGRLEKILRKWINSYPLRSYTAP